MLYLLFVVIAFIFWLFLSLDNEVQEDFEIPIELQEIPDSVMVINDVPKSVMVSVKGKGIQLLKYRLTNPEPLKIKWAERARLGSFRITSSQLDGIMHDYFGSTIKIVGTRPDSLRLDYTTLPPRVIPVTVVTQVTPAPQYAISGPIWSNVKSVKAYATSRMSLPSSTVETETLVASGLKDTTHFNVRIKPINGVKFVPAEVTVTVPVEQLIARSRTVTVEPVNVPENEKVTTFPATVTVSYLVPMGQYKVQPNIKAYADYSGSRHTDKLYVFLSGVPKSYTAVKVIPDSVEYIIERLATDETDSHLWGNRKR